MRRIPHRAYPSASEIAEKITALENRAMDIPPTSAPHCEIMKEIAQLRMYLEAKQWLAPTVRVPAEIEDDGVAR